MLEYSSKLTKRKQHNKSRSLFQFQAFDRIEWLKSHVPQSRLTDRTVKLKYLVHPSELKEHLAVKKVFDRFDDDGNSKK